MAADRSAGGGRRLLRYLAATLPHAPHIPLMWSSDVVHGHKNIVGATIFPRSIGAGAAGYLELMRRIGRSNATAMLITGPDRRLRSNVSRGAVAA